MWNQPEIKGSVNIRTKFRQYVDDNHLYGRRGYSALEHRCRQLLRCVGELAGRTMLEIGGGEGLFSLWAFTNGVQRAVILEPGGAGAKHGAAMRFMKHRQALCIPEDSIALYPQTLQEYEAESGSFDLVLSYSSINHLDERACISLSRSRKARAIYLSMLEKVYGLIGPGGWFIISDCGHGNYWRRLGARSPFARTIEWEKHQDPPVWRQLLEEVGFEFVKLDWHRFYPLRWLGRLASNRIVALATTSQFIMTVRKPCH